MKILFNNLVELATITALFASQNYPVTNIASSSLRKRWQSSTDIDTATIYFEDDAIVSDFHYAFTNATLIVLRLYDYDTTLLYTHTVTTPIAEGDAIEFAAVPDVAYAEVYIESAAIGTYLGGVGLGEDVTLPNPRNEWDEEQQDNSLTGSNPTGQANQDRIEAIRQYSWELPEFSVEEKNEAVDLYRSVGLGRPLWMDPFELNHDFCAPLFARIVEFAPVKTGRTYSITLGVMEAK